MFIWLVLVIVSIGNKGVMCVWLINFIWIGVKLWCNLIIMRGKNVFVSIVLVNVLLIFKIVLILFVILFDKKFVNGWMVNIVMIFIINIVMSGVMIILIVFGIVFWICFFIIIISYVVKIIVNNLFCLGINVLLNNFMFVIVGLKIKILVIVLRIGVLLNFFVVF